MICESSIQKNLRLMRDPKVHHEKLDERYKSNGEMEVSVMASVTPLPLLLSLP